MNNTNIFGTSKKSLAGIMYNILIDEGVVDADMSDTQRFTDCFLEVLKDYSLTLKTSVIE
ncbi:hypothetical protein FMM80_22250 [Schaedlerella arabinosiphila]|jgi:hypothetical protein|uniref:Uncharacterized protein n=1 Tax=Schaedlerella arabinosiphila TaxID=2044587 RepID=A0A9X5CBE8_9FIRM|nr:hypothetical protein [Schaedlerella arabinosiphila]KAI4442180.1 hypothetical protein C824_004690 [Schaedlerella arabinosiphila]NDO71225.1 hypothetical protein [Schaedlerella arabinosiphila]